MNIIQKQPNPSGAYPPVQSWSGANPPDGYAELPNTLDTTDLYAHNGFVELTLANGKFDKIAPNLDAWAAWKASLPIAPAKSGQGETDKLKADIDILASKLVDSKLLSREEYADITGKTCTSRT